MTRPTLVLLHGVGLDHTMWDPVVALMAGDAEVVTPDLPGHGARPPAPAGVTLAELADGVAADIPPGSHLVGFSLGALVAQHLALHRPALVATLTSVSSVCRRTAEERTAVLDRLRTAERDARLSSRHRARRTPHAPRRTAPGVRRLPVHLHRSEHTCLTKRNCSTCSGSASVPSYHRRTF